MPKPFRLTGAAYRYPNDDDELDRMDLLHGMVKMLHGDKLHLSPLDNPQRILDVGAGSGIWAIEMGIYSSSPIMGTFYLCIANLHPLLGMLYPKAEITGTDLSPVQPNEVPENVHFFVDDATDGDWLWPPDHFDMIHTSHLAGSFPSFLSFMHTSFKHLKPGGYLECLEYDFTARCDDDTLPPPNPDGQSAYSYNDWIDYHKLSNRQLDPPRPIMIAAKLARWMREAGFVDVVEHINKVPMNKWPKDPRMKQLGAWNEANWLGGLAGFTYAPFGPGGLGWSKTEIEVFLVDVRKSIRNRRIHAYQNIYAVTGRKPHPGGVVPES